MKKVFSLDMPFLRFARNTALVSVASLVPLLVVYLVLRPGFGAMLLDGGPALSRFLRQVATNRLPVVFVVNYIGFFLFSWTNSRWPRDRHAALVILIDMPARIGAFILLHFLIYVLSADWFDSFGGSRTTAMQVVATTLAKSALFQNISGVYLYATLVSALPLYATAIARSVWLESLVRRGPKRFGPQLLALVLFMLLGLMLTGVAIEIDRLQPS